jgi:hypothetical protein
MFVPQNEKEEKKVALLNMRKTDLLYKLYPTTTFLSPNLFSGTIIFF